MHEQRWPKGSDAARWITRGEDHTLTAPREAIKLTRPDAIMHNQRTHGKRREQRINWRRRLYAPTRRRARALPSHRKRKEDRASKDNWSWPAPWAHRAQAPPNHGPFRHPNPSQFAEQVGHWEVTPLPYKLRDTGFSRSSHGPRTRS